MALSITRDGGRWLPSSVVARFGERAMSIPVELVAILVAGAVMAVLSLLSGGHPDALKSAGLTGGTPIQGVGEFIDSIKGNLIWLGVTIAGCGIFLIGGLYLAGHSRAQDYGIKFLVGCLIIAGGTGFIA